MTEIETFIKPITSNQNEEFYVFTKFSTPGSQTDIEKGNLSIQITNGQEFWGSKDAITADELSSNPDHKRIKPALEALTDKFSRTQQYTYSINRRDDHIVFRINYELGEGAGLSKLTIQLFPVEDPKAAVCSTLETLIATVNHLRVATTALQRGKSVLQSEVAAIKSLAQDFAATRKDREKVERNFYQGITAVLNLKKKQLRVAAGKEIAGKEKPMEVEEKEQQPMDVEAPLNGEAEAEVSSSEEEESEQVTGDEPYVRVEELSPDRDRESEDW